MAEQATPLVITLWETYGSNMESVAAALAGELKLTLHAQAYSSQEIEDATQEREREGFLGRLLRNFAPVDFSDGRVNPATVAMQSNYAKIAADTAAVVEAEAAQGGVIQGRNGHFLLRDRPNTVHVKLDGPVEARIRNAAAASGIEPERAARRQKVEDDFRSQLAQRLFDFDPRDNGHYDVIVNGAELPVAGVVAIIRAAVQAKTAA